MAWQHAMNVCKKHTMYTTNRMLKPNATAKKKRSLAGRKKLHSWSSFWGQILKRTSVVGIPRVPTSGGRNPTPELEPKKL